MRSPPPRDGLPATAGPWVPLRRILPVLLPLAVACSDDPSGPGSTSWIQVVAGDSHACALTEAGQVLCWGSTESGEAGQTTGPVMNPREVEGEVRFRRIAAGGTTTCGISTDGSLHCWGNNALGQLGNGGTENSFRPVRVSGDLTWTDVSVGTYHVCGIDSVGRLHCWGGDRWDVVLGYPGPNECPAPAFESTWPCSRTPIPDLSPGSFDWVEAGLYQTCGGGGLAGAVCWGTNDAGQLGGSTGGICASNDALHPSSRPCSRDPIAPEGVALTHLQPGTTHGCGLDEDGRILCWGGLTLNFGQLGHGSLDGSSVPVPVSAGGPYVRVYTSHGPHIRTFSCGIEDGGRALCWGANRFGQLGSGPSPECGASEVPCRSAPTPVSGNPEFESLALGVEFACGLTTQGDVLCWGANSEGQLGDGTLQTRDVPGPIAG